MSTTEQDREYLKTLTILLIEDDDTARVTLSRLLARCCASIIQAYNGADGFESYTAHHPDIVITDVQMPVMDGYVVAQKIRALDDAIPIIITTAFEDSDDLQRFDAIGVNRYVRKPVIRDQLLLELLDCARCLHKENSC